LGFIGKTAIFLPKWPSTNDIASEKAAKKTTNEGTLIYTDHQISGRGQRGNSWESREGKNLTFSVIFRPGFLEISSHFFLNVFVSLAIYDFLSTYVPKGIKIKWPNDILCNDRKIAGILIENSIRGTSFTHAIAGIGLNVNQNAFITENAVSLSQICNREFDINNLLLLLCEHLEHRYKQLEGSGLEKLEKDYISRLYRINEVHTFKAEKTFRGKIRGIDETGRLIVETDEGLREFMFKEIEYLP